MGNENKLVLVIDDDRDLRELLMLLLEGAGYRVAIARDGRDALEKIEQEFPSIILLDMKMPGMNGWQFSAAFRERYGHRAPIVVVTAAEDARSTAEDIGAEAWLGKPFELDDVLALIERHSGPGAEQPATGTDLPRAQPRN